MTCTIGATKFYSLKISRNENERDIIALKRNLQQIIWQCYLNGVTEFYVNAEFGVPFWCAEIICALKAYNNIKLHIIAPYEEHTRDWYEELRDRYYTVIEKADSVEFASTSYSENCYNEADELMADESDIVLLIGNKSDKFYISGYAKDEEITVRYVNIEELLELI